MRHCAAGDSSTEPHKLAVATRIHTTGKLLITNLLYCTRLDMNVINMELLLFVTHYIIEGDSDMELVFPSVHHAKC